MWLHTTRYWDIGKKIKQIHHSCGLVLWPVWILSNIFDHCKNLTCDTNTLKTAVAQISVARSLLQRLSGCTTRGTAILIKKKCAFYSNKINDPDSRYVVVLGTLYQKPVILPSIYTPNLDNHSFIESLKSFIPNLDSIISY